MFLGSSKDNASILIQLGHCTLYYNTTAGAGMRDTGEKRFWEPERKVERPVIRMRFRNREASMDHDVTLHYIYTTHSYALDFRI
jgi:hypothetical protein